MALPTCLLIRIIPQAAAMGNSVFEIVVTVAFLAAWILVAGAWSIPRWLRGEFVMPARPSAGVSWSAAWGVAAWWLSMFLVNVAYGFVLAGRPLNATAVLQVNALIQVTAALVLFGMIRFTFPNDSPPPASDWGWPGEGTLRDLLWGMRLFALTLPVVLLALLAVSVIGLRAAGKEGQHEFIGMMAEAGPDPVFLFWTGLAVVVVAPFVEEFQYRVVLQPSIEKALGTPSAVWCTALLFAAAHFKPTRAGNPDWIPIIPLGIAFGYMYARRRNYLACVAMHAAFNAYNFALVQLGRFVG